MRITTVNTFFNKSNKTQFKHDNLTKNIISQKFAFKGVSDKSEFIEKEEFEKNLAAELINNGGDKKDVDKVIEKLSSAIMYEDKISAQTADFAINLVRKLLSITVYSIYTIHWGSLCNILTFMVDKGKGKLDSQDIETLNNASVNGCLCKLKTIPGRIYYDF